VARCETSLDALKEELEGYVWTFRWLWFLNLAAVVYGLYVRIYELVAFAVVSGMVSVVGIGRARRGRRLLDRAVKACIPDYNAQDEA
jgi:hypothetical protein